VRTEILQALEPSLFLRKPELRIERTRCRGK
jgi:hypothetical protein